MKTGNWRFWTLLAFLLFGGAVINVWERTGEAKVERSQLGEFPTQIGEWRKIGVDERLDAETENVLRADDYLIRNYAMPDGQISSLYVGYYASQRSGASYHSPLNCLPGSGWEMNSPALERISPVDGSSAFEANRYVLRKNGHKQLMIYWYEGRGRRVASEYWGKIFTVFDSARRRRSDGAMVRVIVPFDGSEEKALGMAREFSAQIAPFLSRYVPN